MTTPKDEPSQQSIFTRLSAALGLSEAAPPLQLSPEQLKRHQKTLVAMELMKRNHLHSLLAYDDFRRNLIALANEAKAQESIASNFIDDFVNECLADYSDELKLLVAAQGTYLREEALREPDVVIAAKDVTPASSSGTLRWSDIRRENMRQVFRRGFGIVVLFFLLLVLQSAFYTNFWAGLVALFICVPIGIWIFLFSFGG